jgi:NAD(P)-dependent dehydrogenase (short-subunit alcohol dehydrogenase family)
MASHPRHVLITGGSRGIGLAIAQLFAKKAYRCTLISRSETNLKTAKATLAQLPSSLQAPINDDHGYIAGDITQGTHFWSSHPDMPFGAQLPKGQSASKIDVVVNCAGITQSSLLVKTSVEDIERIMSTNLSALMIGTKFLLRNAYIRGPVKPSADQMQYPTPTIINVASLLGLQGGYGAVAYAASKAGVVGFTRALASEYASHRVRVNAIVPGYIETEMTKDLDEDALRQRIPLGRLGKPEEIAQAALFLAENDYAHNCVVNLDGGLSAV